MKTTTHDQNLPIYQQYDHVDPPGRFERIASAYIRHLQEFDRELSERRFFAGGHASRSFLSNLRHKPKVRPTSYKVQITVDKINQLLHQFGEDDQHWPDDAAMFAAGRSDEFLTCGRVPIEMAIEALPVFRDSYPETKIETRLLIMEVGEIAQRGMEEASLSRPRFPVTQYHSLIAGRIEGYPVQQADDWFVLALSPDIKPDDRVYALLRQGTRLYAKPRSELAREEKPLCWLVGCIILPS